MSKTNTLNPVHIMMCLSYVWYLSFGHRYQDIVSMNDDERRNFLSLHGG